MKLIAIQEVRYAAINRFPGDEFEATDSDARLLKAIGKAKDAVANPVVTKSAKTEEPVAQPSTAPAQTDAFPQAQDDKTAGRRHYMRRDMAAKE